MSMHIVKLLDVQTLSRFHVQYISCCKSCVSTTRESQERRVGVTWLPHPLSWHFVLKVVGYSNWNVLERKNGGSHLVQTKALWDDLPHNNTVDRRRILETCSKVFRGRKEVSPENCLHRQALKRKQSELAPTKFPRIQLSWRFWFVA